MHEPAILNERRYQAIHAESVAGTLLRTLQRVVDSLDGADPGAQRVARLAVQDAELLAQRVHALRRRVEGIGG